MTAGVRDPIRWIDLPSARDPRGVLTAVESGQDIPFEIRRIFLVHHVEAPRGGHAHRDTDQVLVAAYGSFRARVFDGVQELEFDLADPTRGLYVPRMFFVEMDAFSPGAVCLVLASSHYDRARSIRSREAFLETIESGTRT